MIAERLRAPCSACRAERAAGGRWGYCRPCSREYDRLRLRRRANHCSTCRVPLTTIHRRCRACETAYRDRFFARRDRRCPSCEGPIRAGYRSHWCPDCESLDHRERTLARQEQAQARKETPRRD